MRTLMQFARFFYALKGMALVRVFLVMLAAAVFETMGISMVLPLIGSSDVDNPIRRAVERFFALCGMEYTLARLLLLMVLIFFIRTSFLIWRSGFIGSLLADILTSLRVKTMREIIEVKYLYYITKDRGYIHNAVAIEYQRLAMSIRTFFDIILAALMCVFYISLPLFMSPTFVVFFLALGVPMYFVVRKINTLTSRYSILMTRHSALFQSLLIQALSNFRYIKSTNMSSRILHKLNSESVTLSSLIYKQYLIQGVNQECFMPIVVILVSISCYYIVEVEGAPISQALFSLFMLYKGTLSVYQVQNSYQGFLTNVGSILVYNDFTSELVSNREITPEVAEPAPFDKPIRLENVAFSFYNGPEVLRDINITIPVKGTVAIVGPSGSGKSTIVGLLTKVYEPTRGRLLLGDVPYDAIDTASLRSQIGYVTQESVIFNDTIGNNISMWDPVFSEARLEHASRMSHILPFIDSTDKRFDAMVGDNGVNMSGGQKQRLNIARELYKDTKLLIFDEATSSLDSESERIVQDNIERLRGEKTIVIVAHRLSTIRHCDIVYVLKDGVVVEQGSFQQLYASNGVFTRMVDLQSIGMDATS